MSQNQTKLSIGYVNVAVKDLKRSVIFFRDALGLELQFADPDFGYASFNTASGVSFGIVQNAKLTEGKDTGVGFMVTDLDSVHADFSAKGVQFEQPPTREDWGGYMAIFTDPDGNAYYLDQIEDAHADQKDSDATPEFDFSVNLTAGSVDKPDTN